MRYPIWCILLAILANGLVMAMNDKIDLHYKLTIQDPHTHYLQVDLDLTNVEGDSIDLILPVWAPGSYLIREFAKNVDSFCAEDKGEEIRYEKIAKHTWRLFNKGKKAFRVSYRVYCYELSVRTSYIDASKAYFNGTSIFMHVADQLDRPVTIEIDHDSRWEHITATLGKKGDYYYSPNFDILYDSSILIGNQEIHRFEAKGIPHLIAFEGGGNYDAKKIIADLIKITDVETDLFGDNPCEEYTYIVLNTASSYGGLEHLNSTSLIYPRWNYNTENGYFRFISLCAHEYFHLWNVKRIRPFELGPFDYTTENYTHNLWVAEGFTSYYDEYLLRRANMITEDKYLDLLANVFNYNDNTPGARVQPLVEASFDAWIKYYRQNENSHNCAVSYYTGGAAVVAAFDLVIRHNSNGEKSMDDVMRYLYENIYKAEDRGYTDDEMRDAIESVMGERTDSFIDKYIYHAERPDFEKYLAYVGLTLVNRNADSYKPSLGISTNVKEGKTMIKKVTVHSSAYDGGLNVGDEIISLNGYRVGTDLSKILSRYKVGDEMKVLVTRDGMIEEFVFDLKASRTKSYKLVKNPEASDKAKRLYKQWMGVEF